MVTLSVGGGGPQGEWEADMYSLEGGRMPLMDDEMQHSAHDGHPMGTRCRYRCFTGHNENKWDFMAPAFQ